MLFAQEFNQRATGYNDGTVIVQLIPNLFYFISLLTKLIEV